MEVSTQALEHLDEATTRLKHRLATACAPCWKRGDKEKKVAVVSRIALTGCGMALGFEILLIA